MPLNLSVNDGDITPYIKYNAKAGRFYVRPQGATEDVEIDKPRLAIDMANIKTGWIFYQEGAGPEKVWDPSRSQASSRPAGPRKFKRGFEVMVFGGDPIPGIGKLGLREFSSTASNVITSILGMFADYEAGLVAHPNQIPFYACLGVKPIQGSYGTNYEPQFVLKSWVPREKIPAFNVIADADIGWDEAPPPSSPEDYGGLGMAPAAAPTNTRRASSDFDDNIPF